MKKKVVLSVLIGVCLILLIVLGIQLTPYINYKYATHLYNEKKYIDASEVFFNLETYRDSKDMYNKSQLNLMNEYMKNDEYDNAILISKELKKNAKYKKAAVNTIYEIAENYYIQADFSNAKLTLSLINDDIANNAKISSLMEKIDLLINLQGSWGNSLSYRYIKGFTISDKIDIVGGTFQVNSNNKEIIEDSQANRNDVKITYYLKDGKLICRVEYLEDFWISKAGDITEIEFNKLDIVSATPKIGMTREQALKTTWGAPKDINKHTYSWGVTEQWCYSDNRYIYIENGIVTSISE